MLKAHVPSRGQVALPKEIREQLGLQEGAALTVSSVRCFRAAGSFLRAGKNRAAAARSSPATGQCVPCGKQLDANLLA